MKVICDPVPKEYRRVAIRSDLIELKTKFDPFWIMAFSDFYLKYNSPSDQQQQSDYVRFTKMFYATVVFFIDLGN